MVDTFRLQRRPITLFNISRNLCELIGRDFASPVSFDSFFYFATGA
jgi:hypothetical protein